MADGCGPWTYSYTARVSTRKRPFLQLSPPSSAAALAVTAKLLMSDAQSHWPCSGPWCMNRVETHRPGWIRLSGTKWEISVCMKRDNPEYIYSWENEAQRLGLDCHWRYCQWQVLSRFMHQTPEVLSFVSVFKCYKNIVVVSIHLCQAYL